MAIQLAHYRLHRAFAPTYETGHTRAFYHGRTDTVRTCSLASCAFVRAMEDPHATAAHKWSALKAACVSHGERLPRVPHPFPFTPTPTPTPPQPYPQP